ncbi:Auxin efflux carrier family protein [Striga hermonthica]|uniref:Auxin efflux carrier family protein n=1 Tax=Striga hermonthica TaxID=68872 RepID=A0A9N7MWK6_STRHE|nr:Auxin efflux carrier family protein [Striga hermonthica]
MDLRVGELFIFSNIQPDFWFLPISETSVPLNLPSIVGDFSRLSYLLEEILLETEQDAPLSFVTDSLEILAAAMVPSVMLILGGMLAEGPDESRLGVRTTVGIMVARLVVLPIIGMGVVYVADMSGFLVPGDQMYRFVLLLQYTTPSAILLGAVASLRGYAVKEASALLFWQHVFAVLSLAIYVIVYFRMLLSYV